MKNRQPWEGVISTLIVTDCDLSKEVAEKIIIPALKKALKNHFVSAQIEFVEGEWGNPCDLC